MSPFADGQVKPSRPGVGPLPVTLMFDFRFWLLQGLAVWPWASGSTSLFVLRLLSIVQWKLYRVFTHRVPLQAEPQRQPRSRTPTFIGLKRMNEALHLLQDGHSDLCLASSISGQARVTSILRRLLRAAAVGGL